ncbi:BAR and SH3 9 domain containing protein [Trichuris trichiura]|uniref:BAR and SH3 9 domain containing protein n=1 Tax=Trichuris trichiura TaxID=36087 RepID=A0A077ZCW2_TRITR|nr:BAR and SH3 9 domain containing protein [Trichuris trichiura]
MSFAGLKKQINKANQYVSERVGAAEATKLDECYQELEKKVDITTELIDDLTTKTREFLQPNPATRAKMATVRTISKLHGTTKAMPYPQPEGVLGDSMFKYGRLLGEKSYLGCALIDAGDAFKIMADIKYALEDHVRQNFLDPLGHLLATDLKEVNHHRKKLQGRRLDYDCKRRKQVKDAHLYDEEVRLAEEKLEESKRIAEIAMFNVIDNDVEQVSQLLAFVEAQVDFHRQTCQVLENLSEKLKKQVQEASCRPRQAHIPRPLFQEHSSKLVLQGSNSSVDEFGASATAPVSRVNASNAQEMWQAPQVQDPWAAVSNGSNTHTPSAQGPCCKALYDFEPENSGELGFKEGQIIRLISQLDENWFQGSLPNGQSGFFPITYVQVLVPLPSQ